MRKLTVGLYQEHASNLRKSIEKANDDGYDLISTPIVNPQYYREFEDDPMKSRHIVFSRSDLILESAEWLNNILSKISDNIDCDSEDEQIRKHSEKVLIQELSFADHLVQYGFITLRLNSSKSLNLARIVSRNIKGMVMAEVPMINPKSIAKNWRKDSVDTEDSTEEDTWTWWNKFRTYADFHNKIVLSLELSADIPPKEEILRWLGEPVSSLIIPSYIFIRNAQNYPVLSRAHQSVVASFLKNEVALFVKCNHDEGSIRYYSDYLKHIGAVTKSVVDPMQGFDDILEIPLQPLYDNLDSYTYEVFEKDPIKYLYYQKAIELALIDKVSNDDIPNKTIIVMVVGAGRGPIVRAALNAATNTGRKIKLFIVEKNPNAVITLTALVNELWPDKDICLISCDMREFTPPEKVDILVSELLGSFGDNELSPECLDGAQQHLKDDGISIPNRSTSYINPLMSSQIYNLVRVIEKHTNPREKIRSYASQAESNYVVYLKRAYHIADPQPLFVFEHPNRSKNIDNSRFTKLRFEVTLDCVLHGFSGYFDTVLYKDIMLSIHPETHSHGLCSWFSMFFPITEPMQLKKGDVIEVNFWRCISAHKVWYEWSISSPTITHIHNHNGRHCPIYK